jgi:chromosomal replication initiator protein
MTVCTQLGGWLEFIEFARSRCTHTAFENWLAPIQLVEESDSELVLQVPNVFVQEYLLENYAEDLRAFVPVNQSGKAAVRFVVQSPSKKTSLVDVPLPSRSFEPPLVEPLYALKLNPHYTFENFIEGASNQFVKSAAFGVAQRPGRSYNPLFIHGGVGLGKTHLLHAIGYHVQKHHKRLKVHCITTEAFINDLVDSLKNKSVDKMKKFKSPLAQKVPLIEKKKHSHPHKNNTTYN